MSFPVAQTTAQIVSSIGANSQEQKWVKSVVIGSLGRSPFAEMSGPMAGNKAIGTTSILKDLKGQTINLKVEAPLGGAGTQGAGSQRSGNGEEIKWHMYTLSIGNHHHSVSQNNVSAEQTMLGIGSFDAKAKEKLKEWFAKLHGTAIEGTIITACETNSSRLVVYPNGKTSINSLGGADTMDQNFWTLMSQTMTTNQAEPFRVGMINNQAIDRYAIICPNNATVDMRASNTWQTLQAQGCDRGSTNSLFTGKIPDWNGSWIYEWVVQNNTADGPQGSLMQPIAFTGATIPVGSAAFNIVGGGSLKAGQLTTPLYFQYFDGAEVKTHEVVRRAQETTNEKLVIMWIPSVGKYGIASWKTTDGNRLTGFKKLGSVNAGTVSKIVGGIDWDNLGPWTGKVVDLLSVEVPVGTPIYQVNTKGQAYVRTFGIARNCLTQGWGSVTAGQSLGKRTQNNNDDMQRFAQIGFEEQWGINANQDANGLTSGLLMGVVAYNPPGAPTNIV